MYDYIGGSILTNCSYIVLKRAIIFTINRYNQTDGPGICFPLGHIFVDIFMSKCIMEF